MLRYKAKKYSKQIISALVGLLIISLSAATFIVDIPLIGDFLSFLIVLPFVIAFDKSTETKLLILAIYLSIVWFIISWITYLIIDRYLKTKNG